MVVSLKFILIFSYRKVLVGEQNNAQNIISRCASICSCRSVVKIFFVQILRVLGKDVVAEK